VYEPAPSVQGSYSEQNQSKSISFDSEFEPQSAEHVDHEQIVQFVNAESVPEVGTGSTNHVFSTTDMTTDTNISDFFARPVRIASYTWNESTTPGLVQNINPWALWATSTYVKLKLNNYSWFRGDLKIKIQLTASPFYYGLTKVVYQPLPNFTPSTIAFDAATRYFIPLSQRPTMDLDPSVGDTYTMTLPFIYPANWLNVQRAASFIDLGKLEYYVYNQLKSANGVTSTGITVLTYAWVENVQLSGASIGFSVQSDEYGEGCVSKPASWVANAASYFESVPIIGPFATATKIGAGAISSIA